MLKMSALKLFMVANLHYQFNTKIILLYSPTDTALQFL